MAVETTTFATEFDADAAWDRLETKVLELKFAVAELCADDQGDDAA